MKSDFLYYVRKYVRKDVRKVLRRALYYAVFKLADIFGFWRYPADRDPEQNFHFRKILNRMYWNYKNAKPIIKPEKGSELDAYFAEKRRHFGRPLLPEGFQGEMSVEISAVGDLMKTKGIENSAGKLYAKIAELIFDADISIANLESSLTSGNNQDNSRGKINATHEQFDTLKGHKGKQYTVFCTANNHILDCGMEGFRTTHDLLEAEGFNHIGTNRSLEAQKQGVIIASNGVKFGFVAATYSLNLRPFPNGKDYLVNVIPFHRFQGRVDVSLLEEQISYCRSQDCDFTIVSLHWGMEFEFFPRQDQVDIAHHLIECGADAIIGHHTHNIQPYEFYQPRRDSYRKAPIFYGLGNLSTVFSAPYNALSLITNFKVVKGHVNGVQKALVSHVDVTPVLQMKHDCTPTPYIQIEKLSDLIKSAHTESRSGYINEAAQYADFVLGRSWRN